LAEVVHQEKELPTQLVVEASSFQLFDATRLQVGGAVFTAYAPNHLDWHPNEEHYRETKLSLLDRLLPQARVVYLPGFPGLIERLGERPLRAVPVAPGEIYSYDQDFPGQICTPSGSLDLRELEGGATLVSLSPAIALAAASAEVGPQEITRAAATIQSLPHRLENCGMRRGRRFINDSKATTPAASAYALERIPGDTVLILGGKDKGLEFAPFASRFARAARLVFTGAARDRLERELGHLPHDTVPDFDAALKRALELCPQGGAVLLAPGCSSFDHFPNFEARGQCFRDFVASLGDAE
jgi:UDP-N-acetylmuramoylalanine--D-glutamate ligase